MFLAAAPYFQRRFQSDKTLLKNFQPTEVSVSTLANLGSMLVLAKLQANASYPKRISSSLVLVTVSFALLTISTKAFTWIPPSVYFGFFVVIILASSTAVGILQNGVFSFVSGYRRSEYMQGIMAGQAVAGVLPPLVQIISVLSAGKDDSASSDSALAYFGTATAVSAFSFNAFLYLLRFHPATSTTPVASTSSPAASSDETPWAEDEDPRPPSTGKHSSIPLTILARKLLLRALAVFLTFALTMVFPVFTQEILSTKPHGGALFAKDAFIPFAFLVWNAGDLAGRLLPLWSRVSLIHRPGWLLVLSILRIVWVPLYLLCNITDLGAETRSTSSPMGDAFYLLVVQFPFGLTNGYLGSSSMMGASDQVDEHEKEAAGGFMALCLVGGLTIGSLFSFVVGNG